MPDQCCSPGCENGPEEGWLYCEPCLYDQGYRPREEAQALELATNPIVLTLAITAALIAAPFVKLYRWLTR